jgi:predicted ATPase
MLEKIHIQNFKSLYDLEISVGRVNLFIGENGSGKSNLLEALVFVSASETNKLGNEFLVSRGIRVPEPTLMRSAFSNDDKDKDITVTITYNGETIKSTFYNNYVEYSAWKTDEEILNNSNEIVETINEVLSTTRNNNGAIRKEYIERLDTETAVKLLKFLTKLQDNSKLKKFLIYSPENTALRTFEKEGQIQPLGINGEGLLKLLKVINNYEDKSYITTIIESLKLFNWFEDITIPSKENIENHVVIKDKYLYREIDQRSANEGFLFILFYITLIVAKETPKAFAIDNIDASLNPKLCTKLMTIIADLAKKYDKQIFLTTHNPAILDGIDLNDKEQKLFVVSRNKSGHTRMKEITAQDKPKSSNDEPLHLSEAFMRGYLGGLPKGF